MAGDAGLTDSSLTRWELGPIFSSCVWGHWRMYEHFLFSSVDGKGEDERKTKLGLS